MIRLNRKEKRMLLYGNEREIQQGEDWNLDILLSQSSSEYVPFIVSSERRDPMWAITVASTKFEKNDRYVATWWLSLNEGLLPRFYQTTPYDINEIPKGQVFVTQDPPMYALYRYTKEEESLDIILGHKPYHYVYFDENGVAHGDEYGDKYECRIRMQFPSLETSQWGSQNYMYQITLVDTVSMGDYVNLAHDEYPNLNWPKWVNQNNPDWEKPIRELNEDDVTFNNRVEESWKKFRNSWIMSNINELFTFIKNRIPGWFQSDIDKDSPVGQIDVPQIILPPTKLQVNSNLRKII